MKQQTSSIQDPEYYINQMFFNSRINYQHTQRQKLKRYCKKIGHQQGVVQILCMQETCKQNRLCCKFCQAENHRTHDYILLQQNVKTPLMNLKIHAGYPKGYEYFMQLIQKIKQQKRNMMKFIQEEFKILLERFESQFQTVAQTFKQDLYQKALCELKNCQIDDSEKQNHYLNLIKILSQIPELGNADKIMKQGQIVAKTIFATLNQMKKDIKQIFTKNKQKLRITSLLKMNYKLIKQEQSEQNKSEQMFDLDNTQIHHQTALIGIAKNKSDRQLKGVKKHKKMVQKLSKQSLKITTQKNISYEIPIRQIANNDHKFTKILQQKPILQKQQRKSLTIQSDTSPNISNELVLEKIKDYNQLQEIRINWSCNLKQDTILEILKRFPMLKRISIGFCPAIGQNILNYLLQHFPELEYFNFGLDYQLDYYKFTTDSSFFNPQIKNSWNIVMNQKLTKFKNLQNISIPTCLSPKVSKIISELKSLKYVKIGRFDQRQKLSPQITLSLIERINLKSLSLQNLVVDQIQINSVFLSNKNLTAILLSSCTGITDQTIKVISQCCKNVSTFYLNALKISGKYIWLINTIKFLTIMCCCKIDFVAAKNGVKNLANLELLDISFNNWVNDTFLQQLKGLNKLKALNFHHNNITDKGLQSLKDVRLQLLTCGKTLIRPQKLSQFFQSNNQIVKLCLEGLGQDNQPLRLNQQCLIKILESLPRLTHLNIRNINMISISPFLLIKLKKLKCLTIDKESLTKKQQNQLYEQRIDINYQT